MGRLSATATKEITPKNAGHRGDMVTPNWRQNAKTIQKFGTVIKDLPIALDESARREITERLNVLLADTASFATFTRSHTGRSPDQLFISFICFLTSILPNRST